jgi:hypothetical protein
MKTQNLGKDKAGQPALRGLESLSHVRSSEIGLTLMPARESIFMPQ